jgi:hypothetical protein
MRARAWPSLEGALAAHQLHPFVTCSPPCPCLCFCSCKFLNNLEGFVEGQGAPWNLMSLSKERRGSSGAFAPPPSRSTSASAGGPASSSVTASAAVTSTASSAAGAKPNVILDIEELASLGKEAEVRSR